MPPLLPVAVKVTDVPEQIAPDGDAAILTLTGKLELTVMVMEFEVTGFTDAQLSEDVMTQLTTSPLASELLEYVVLFEPTLLPLTFHW